MPSPTWDAASWDHRWAQVIRDHPDGVAARPPSPYLIHDLSDLAPGRAIDAGCGHGAESLWLARAGWEVTALDFSPEALAYGRASAARLGPEVAGRINWAEADLGRWVPPAGEVDLVLCLYVHVAGDAVELVTRLAGALRPGGTLFMVGHQPIDPATGQPTPAADQHQVGVADARAALVGPHWDLQVAEERVRPQAGSGVDAVIRAQRRR